MPDELPPCPGIHARDGVTQTTGEAGGHGGRNRGSQSLEHRLNHLLGAVVGAHAHRSRRVGVDHQAARSDDLNRPHGTFIAGHVHWCEVHDGRVSQRSGVGVGAVDEPLHLRAGFAEVYCHGVAGDGDPGTDGHELAVETVVIHQRLPVVHPVGPSGNELPDLPLGGRQDLGYHRHQPVGAVVREQRLDSLRRQRHGTYLCVEIAQEILRLPHIGRHHLEQVIPWYALVIKPQRRYAEALLEYLVGARVVTSVGASANVAVVRAVHSVKQKLSFVKNGPNYRDVRQMTAAEIGVVQDE